MARTYYTANTTSTEDFLFESNMFSFLNEPFESCSFPPLQATPEMLPAYKSLLFYGQTTSQPIYKKKRVTKYEFPRVPRSIISHPQSCSSSHPRPLRRLTYKPSPLTILNNTVKQSKKRKFEESSSSRDSSWPPGKRYAPEYQDSDGMKISDHYIFSDEEAVTESPTHSSYEGLVKDSYRNIGFRSVATNTMHVPVW